MKTATGLSLIALGAILAFAITTQPSFLDLHVVGWVLMLTGTAGCVLPRARQGRLRRRTVWRGGRPMHEIEVEETQIEPQFSQLLAPGGIGARLGDPKPAHVRPDVPMRPDDTTTQPGEDDRQTQARGQAVGR